MPAKLTLTIDQSVISGAKKYAQKKGRSLSNLVENYLKTLATKDDKANELSPRVKRLVGAVSLPDDFEYKSALAEELANRHGK